MTDDNKPKWIDRGKSIQQLIQELQSFEDSNLEVRISTDDGETNKPISLIEKSNGTCLLVYCD